MYTLKGLHYKAMALARIQDKYWVVESGEVKDFAEWMDKMKFSFYLSCLLEDMFRRKKEE